MSVTEEDGGKLNAFAREPRMEVIESGKPRSKTSLVILASGAVLVLVLLALAVRIS